jgi:mannitol/fructose-specific phosphotransferase system IIA component (Ntr-type)
MIESYLQVVHMQLNVDATDKHSAIEQMAYLSARNNTVEIEDLKSCLSNREKIRSTGFGKGVAMPHSFSTQLPKIVMSLVTFKTPVEWLSVDGKDVKIAAMVAGPNTQITSYMNILLRLSKILANDLAREQIIHQTKTQDVLDILLHYEKTLYEK